MIADEYLGLDTVLWKTEDGLNFEEVLPPAPGERCDLCDRRVNKPRQGDSPTTKRVGAQLPAERAEWLAETLNHLQAASGADAHSYPLGTLLEAMAALGIQHLDLLKWYLTKEEEAA